MSNKVRAVIRARLRERIRALQHADAEPGLGSVRLESAPKMKAEIQDELAAAGIEYPKRATKAELEALASPTTTPDVADLVAEDLEVSKS